MPNQLLQRTAGHEAFREFIASAAPAAAELGRSAAEDALMADDKLDPAANQVASNKSALAVLGGDAGCVVWGVPLAAAGASVYIFEAAVRAGAPWAGAGATAALALMGLGVVWIVTRGRA